jgi:hypothetical protein
MREKGGRSWPHASSMAWIAAIIALVLAAGAALYDSGRNTSTFAAVSDASRGQNPPQKRGRPPVTRRFPERPQTQSGIRGATAPLRLALMRGPHLLWRIGVLGHVQTLMRNLIPCHALRVRRAQPTR